MAKNMYRFLMLAGLLLVVQYVYAQQRIDRLLWVDTPPHVSEDTQDTAKVSVFLPPADKATGRAVVICPGGGYRFLAIEHEGYQWASFFNQMGIAAIVLKYRMPHGNYRIPLEDAEAAMRLVRKQASTWSINPNDVGIMGFSAGGHLAATVATQMKGDAKANFQILFYPVITMLSGYTHQDTHDNFLGKKASKSEERRFSADMQVSRLTPRAWIALSDDDREVLPANGVNYYMSLYKHDVPASLHVYAGGGHGYGRKTDFRFHNELELELRAWLRSF